MENKIYNMKTKLIAKVEDEMRDMDRLDVDLVCNLIDAVHHLAETEYYCSIADSMWAEKHGYGGGTGSSTPVTQMRQGYSGDMPRWQYAQPQPMGYSDQDPVEAFRSKYQKASPDERERLRIEAMKITGMM